MSPSLLVKICTGSKGTKVVTLTKNGINLGRDKTNL
jgi:hypothetical protein